VERRRHWAAHRTVRGRTRALDDTAEINRHFTPIRVFDEAIEDVDIVIAEFVIDTLTGRKTPAADR